MKKHHVLYDWPIREIRKLADSDEAETYADTLEPDKEAEFALLTEELRSIGSDLFAAQSTPEYSQQWSDLFKALEMFEDQFGDFPNAVLRKFRLFCLLAEKLTAPAPDLNADEIDESLFELREISDPVPVSWFTKENRASIKDSVVLFTLEDLPPTNTETPKLQSELENDPMSPELVFLLLACLGSAEFDATKQGAFVHKTTPQIPDEAVHAFACLSVLSTGQSVHSPRLFPNRLSIVDTDAIRAGAHYHQLNDVINVVSEYNSRKDTLAKYLSLYHAFENFMFKAPIVALERQGGGAMFSIRDFRRLYGEIDKSESDVLNKLFAAVFELEPTPGAPFSDLIKSKWDSFCNAPDEAQLNLLLQKLRWKTKSGFIDYNTFKGNVNAKHFSQLVYAVRNVIVHNTETEWHLTHATFDDSCRLLLEEFLIPTLEEICFHLLSVSNDQVWYSHREIALY